MFKTLEPLDFKKHQDLRLGTVNSFEFAGTLSAVKLAASELRSASRHYPIVMLEDAPGVPQALLSLQPGKNTCLNKDGKWLVPYVPAFLRLYPFTLAKISDQENQFALCIDPDAPHFKTGMGDPMFTANGELTDAINDKILAALKSYHTDLERTVAAFKALDDKGLIVEKTFAYKINQEKKTIRGFKGVDMEKLGQLDDTELAQMVRTGAISMILEHVHSLSNFSKLVAPARTMPI